MQSGGVKTSISFEMANSYLKELSYIDTKK